MSCCQSCTFCLKCERAVTKERRKSLIKSKNRNKFWKSAFSVDHCVFFAPIVPNAHNVVNAQLVGGRLQNCWQKWSLLGANPRVVSILKDGYILPFKIRPPLVRDPLIVSGYANPLRNPYLREALQALLQKEAVEMVRVQTSLAFFNRLFIVPKPNQKWRPILDLSALNKFLSVKTFKMETPETIRIFYNKGNGFQRCLFPHSSSHPVQEVSQVPLPKSVRSVLGPSFWPLNSSDGVHLCGQRGKINVSVPGYKDPPVPRQLVDLSPYQRILPSGHPVPPRPLSGVGLGGEPAKVGVGTQAGVRVCGLQVRSLSRIGQTDPEPLGVDSPIGGVHPSQPNLLSQVLHVSNRPAYSNRKKQVSLGRLHLRPIQWHLKRHWRVPESLEKEIPVPRPLHPHLLWWTKETNVLQGQPLHPLRHAIQIFTDASKEGWGAHLGNFTASGTLSVPEIHLHVNFLELKAVLLAL